MSRIVKTLALAAFAALYASAASAQVPKANYERAQQIIAEKLGADYNTQQVAIFNLAAHSVAVSVLCDSLDLDDAALSAQMDAAIMHGVSTTPDEMASLRNRTQIWFGALVGLMLEEAAPNNPQFCAAAEADMKKQGAGSLLKPHAGD